MIFECSEPQYNAYNVSLVELEIACRFMVENDTLEMNNSRLMRVLQHFPYAQVQKYDQGNIVRGLSQSQARAPRSPIQFSMPQLHFSDRIEGMDVRMDVLRISMDNDDGADGALGAVADDADDASRDDDGNSDPDGLDEGEQRSLQFLVNFGKLCETTTWPEQAQQALDNLWTFLKTDVDFSTVESKRKLNALLKPLRVKNYADYSKCKFDCMERDLDWPLLKEDDEEPDEDAPPMRRFWESLELFADKQHSKLKLWIRVIRAAHNYCFFASSSPAYKMDKHGVQPSLNADAVVQLFFEADEVLAFQDNKPQFTGSWDRPYRRLSMGYSQYGLAMVAGRRTFHYVPHYGNYTGSKHPDKINSIALGIMRGNRGGPERELLLKLIASYDDLSQGRKDIVDRFGFNPSLVSGMDLSSYL